MAPEEDFLLKSMILTRSPRPEGARAGDLVQLGMGGPTLFVRFSF